LKRPGYKRPIITASFERQINFTLNDSWCHFRVSVTESNLRKNFRPSFFFLFANFSSDKLGPDFMTLLHELES
jgi:hypothetical protein